MRVSPLRTSVLLAYAAFVLVGITAGVGGVLLVVQLRDYDVSKTTIGLTFFTFSAGFMLAGSVAGELLHRLGMRFALMLGAGACVLGGLAIAVRPPFVALVLIQIVVGFGIGLIESALNVFLSDLPEATTLINRLHAFFGVGALIGPLLATWTLRYFDWTAVWLILALSWVPLLVGFLLAYPAHAPALVPPGTSPPSRGLFASAVREPAILLAAGFLAVYVGLELSVGNWGFSYLVSDRSQGDLVAGYILSGYWLGLTLGRFLISPVARRQGLTPARMTELCLIGVAAGSLLVWVAPLVAGAGLGFLLLGFFLGPIFPTAIAVVPSLTEARLVPTAIGLINGVSVVGGAAIPWLAGAIGEGMGTWTLLPYTLVLALVQLAMWSRLTRRMSHVPAGHTVGR